jgi:putative heme-binding domain-containing protein
MTWDGRVFYTQPTSGNHFIQVVLPEYVLAKGKLPGVMGTNGMLPKEPVFPAMHAEQQAYVQIDQVGSYTAAAGCAIYEGGAWPAKWNYGYFTTEPTVNIVSHFMVEPDGVAYKAHREPGREQNEFIRSNNIWFRPIEVRVGPEGALYVVDFCNQAVIHNDTRGPVHGPANAAVRPDRDHYYGRIWKVQHKEAKKLVVPTMDKKDSSVLARSILRSENGPTSQLAWRLFRENIGLDKLHEVQNSIYTSEKERQEFGKADSHEINTRLALDAAVNFWAERPATIDSDPVTPATEAEYVVHLTKGLRDAQPQTPEQWYKTLFAVSRYKAGRALIVEHYVKESPDDWTRSAVIAAAAAQPAACIEEALASLQADQLTKFVEVLVPAAIQQGGVKELVMSCASAPASANSLKAVILAALSQQSGIDLASSPELKEALQKLLSDGSTSASALPLIARWDSKGEMSSVVESMKKKMLATLQDGSAPQADSIAAAQGLFAIRQVDKALVGTLLETLASERPLPLREAILTVLSTGNEAEIGSKLAANISKMKPLENKVIDVLLARPAWSQSLLDAVERGEVSAADLGPSNVSRLRTHPNKQVAIRANKMLEKLSPTSVAKIQLIAQLTPEVEKPGDPVKGKMYYAACAVCHKLGDVGAAVGPPLDGMGAHGPAELLVHIVDPNREVDPSFWAQNITTKKGDIIVGVITSENASTITLATQLGVKEVAKIDIATRENTRRSLMPEGLEGLGAETLRDLLAYICGDALKHFRILDLKPAYTADSREGVFAGPSPKQGQVRLAKYGNVKVNGIPFFIQDAAKSSTGANIIVLKGGPQNSQSWTYPQRVEVPVNASAKKLHLLSGIAGWGYPAVRDHVPAVKATVTYASGETEEIVMKNGEEFSDYIRPSEVPGSQLVEDGISADQQVRLISLTLAKTGIIKSLALESFANGVAPVIIAVTADVEGKLGAKVQPAQTTEAKPATQAAPAPAPNADQPGPKEGGKGDGKLAPVTPVSWEAGKTKVLIVGGGSSHNFAKFFGEVDGATLKDAGFSVNYTEDRDQAAAELASADVAVISVNRQFFDFPAYRKALFDRIAAGKGVIMMHPGTWYAYPRWPELNAQIVGGGSRGHDKLGPYSVNVTKADHPIMKGVPASFDVVDELYYVNAEPDKTPAGTAAIEVLAETSPSQKFSKPHPSVWITKNDKARIACIALGHDERTHGDAAFKSILVNAVKWCAGK